VDREIIATRLSKLREALRKLKEIAAKPRDGYLASETDRALAEHYLRLALEAVLDAGNHIVAAEGLRKPMQLRDIPLILGESQILPGELAQRLARATGLRNRLVHVYADIDHEIIFKVLQEDLGDLEAFAVAIATSVESQRG
jgi:uncharacterized protein YutE (UPF0331/DUF86 family)